MKGETVLNYEYCVPSKSEQRNFSQLAKIASLLLSKAISRLINEHTVGTRARE